jgi:peptidoglycan/LPS O-acetylase OafA/YrhL
MADYPTVAIVICLPLAFVAASYLASGLVRLGFPVTPEKNRIGCVDGLRGYLALSVVMHHFIVWLQITRLGGTWEAPGVPLFNQLGAGAVALFFMTTGLVFYPRVLTGFRATSWVFVYVTRVFRIVPLILVSLALITAIIARRMGGGVPLDASYLRAAAIWISTWAEPPLLGYADAGRLNAYVLWSLKYEWLFYILLLPACALAMDLIRGRLPSIVVPLALLGLGLAGRAAIGMSALYSVMTFLPLFALGMLAYETAQRPAIARWLRRTEAAVVAAGALAVSVTIFPTPYEAALPAYALVFACVAAGNSFFGLLNRKGALVLGECSYGIYLLHGTLLNVLFTEGAGLTAAFSTQALPVLMIAAAAAVAIITPVTFLLVERPALMLGRRLGRALTQQGVPARRAG